MWPFRKKTILENLNFFDKIKDTIDGMWVKGLPEKVNIIISGQEYVNDGQIIENK